MLVNVNDLNSHPDKPLFTHVDGVISNVKKLTQNLAIAKWAELVAIFHDLGKINPNFQDKLGKKKVEGYANHAYFSAYAFFCAFRHNKANFNFLKTWLDVDKLSVNDLIALIGTSQKVYVDFCPMAFDNTGADWISDVQEIKNPYFGDKMMKCGSIKLELN